MRELLQKKTMEGELLFMVKKFGVHLILVDQSSRKSWLSNAEFQKMFQMQQPNTQVTFSSLPSITTRKQAVIPESNANNLTNINTIKSHRKHA
jgi:hypothetical protein